MYCVRCGKKAAEGQRTCAECGMRLISPAALLRLLKYAERMKETRVVSHGSEKNTKTQPADERRRVVPLAENPAQPRRKSILEETPPAALKKTARKPAASNPAVKLPPVKAAARAAGETKPPRGKAVDPLFLDDWPEKRRPARKRPIEKNAAIKKSAAKSRKAAPIRREKEGLRSLFLIPERKESRPKKKQETKASPARGKRPEAEKRSKAGPRRASAKKKPVKSVSAAKKSQKRQRFWDKHLRSAVSMALLALTVVLMLLWGTSTGAGRRTFAQMGLGGTRGYILLGDDCMEQSNYRRAVEYYYRALSGGADYEAGLKLSRAYRMTGDVEKEASALLMLMDYYGEQDEPYRRMLEIYPDPRTRPERVQAAMKTHENAH